MIEDSIKEYAKYWDEYYSNHRKPAAPSLFAQFVYKHYLTRGSLLELGCGNGRDSLYFAQNKNLQITAVDLCGAQIKFLNAHYSNRNLNFQEADFTALEGTNSSLAYIYSRFTMHSVSEEKENRALEWCYKTLADKGCLLIETRSIKDQLYNKGTKVPKEKHAFVTDHYRRFAEFETLQAKLKLLNFTLVYSEESSGFAPYQ